MKIFYSWQSDLDNKSNRGFIKNAIEKAIKDLNIDLDINEPDRKLELDHDTKNVPGTPDLAGTIFEKIASSTVFIADISFIAERHDDNGKVLRKVANPNVLIELGYALSKLGSDKIILIFNTAYGSTDDLPFDLKHKRHPIQYNLTNDSTDKSEQKNNLVISLKKGIELIVGSEKYTKTQPVLPSNPSRQQIFQAIISSDSKEDWDRAGITDSETKYYKKNVHLRFEVSYGESGIQNENFKETWANRHPDPSAVGYWHHLYFGSTHIESFILVSVDGARANLPLPKNAKNLVVSPLYYKVAQIHDSLSTLDEYMIRSGLRLADRDLEAGLGDGSGFGFGSGAGAGNADGSGQG